MQRKDRGLSQDAGIVCGIAVRRVSIVGGITYRARGQRAKRTWAMGP